MLVARTPDWELGELSSIPSSVTDMLADLEQVLHFSFSFCPLSALFIWAPSCSGQKCSHHVSVQHNSAMSSVEDL